MYKWLFIIPLPFLTRTRNYQIHEFDWLKSMLDKMVQIFLLRINIFSGHVVIFTVGKLNTQTHTQNTKPLACFC